MIMNARLGEPRRWNRRTWCGVVAGVLAAQLLLVFLLSGKPQPPGPPAAPSGVFRMLTRPADLGEPPGASAWADPAQSALISAQGYSGPAWLRRPWVEPGRSEWREPPCWLTQQIANLLTPFTPAAVPAPFTPVLIADRSPSTPTVVPQLDRPILTNSVLRMEGSLRRRPLLNPPLLPSWEFNDVLLPTTVQVFVDEQGAVWNATLLSPSGLPAADQLALDLTRSLRFAALQRPGAARFAWGTLTFQWHTHAPPSPSSSAVP